MKKIFFLVSFLFTGLPIFSQVSDGPKEVTPELKKKINAKVEKQILMLKSALEKRKVNKTEIEFTLDTARIEIFMGKYTAYDNSDFGLNTALYEAKEKYDKLLNKYYQKLMSVLKGREK